MSIYLSILMALLVIGTFSFVWERRWKGRRVATAQGENRTAPSQASVRERLTQSVATFRANLPLRRRSPALEAQFRTWSEQALAEDGAVHEWLTTLSSPAYAAFVEHIAEFAEEMGFDLADLVHGKMACLPTVADRANNIVVHYCRANYQAALAQGDFDGYRLYAAYRQAPTSAAGQQFTQQLYAQLVDQQIVAPPTPEFLALSEQERLTEMQEMIRQAAEKPDTFRTALHTVAAERQRTAADFTVANIVQRAMTRIPKPKADTDAVAQPATPQPLATPDDTSDEPAVTPV